MSSGVQTARNALERDGLVVVVLALLCAVLVELMPRLLVQDTWLALVDGRLIARHGLPHTDTLTYWTLGRSWIDPQWGAHLALYELARHGGLRLAAGFTVGCVVATLALLAWASRRLGASSPGTALVLAMPVVATPWLAQVRSQSFGLAPFMLLYALLAFDSRRPGRRVLWSLPLLAIWANLHGSAALGAALALLYGLGLLRTPATRLRGVALTVGSPVCLLLSPYGFRVASYYRLMLLRPPLARYVQEWMPLKLSAATAVFVVAAIATAALWSVHRRALTPFERWILPVLLAAAILAERNTIWFALAATLALPRMIDAARPSGIELTRAIRRANLGFASVAVALAGLTIAVAAERPRSWIERDRSPAAAAAVLAAAGPRGIVLADDDHADWLLWVEPSLTGRVAYDVRFELFDGRQLQEIRSLRDGGVVAWSTCGALASVATFGNPAELDATRRRLSPGARTIVRTATFAAARQQPRAGGPCGI